MNRPLQDYFLVNLKARAEAAFRNRTTVPADALLSLITEVQERRAEASAPRQDRPDIRPQFVAGEDILAGALVGVDPLTGHILMAGRIEPYVPKHRGNWSDRA